MGCDITIHCEYKDKNGKWRNCDDFFWNPENKEYECVEIYSGRNYELFGVLAGVRDNSLPQITERKGFPEDASEVTKAFYKEWENEAHSMSWLTLRELLDYKKKRKKKYKKLSKINKPKLYPDYWNGMSEGVEDSEGYVFFKNDYHVLDYLINRLKVKLDQCGYWYCNSFEEKAEDIRIVFWFDS